MLLKIAFELQDRVNELVNKRLSGQDVPLKTIHKLSKAQQLIEEACGELNGGKTPFNWDVFVETGEKIPKWQKNKGNE